MTSSIVINDAVRGLAAGDALSWTAAGHRMTLLPSRRAQMVRELDAFAEKTLSTTRPVPHAHSSPTDALRPRPADDVEWFVFTADALLRSGADGVASAWQELAQQSEPVHARIGTQHALANLKRGLGSPQSGNDNPHYFDDIACVRAIAAGLLGHRSNEVAAELARTDAQVTHSNDGVWCAVATAVLVAELARGAEPGAAIAAAVATLPSESWSRRLSELALTISARSRSALDLAFQLDQELTDKIYSYAIAAPETFAVLIAHVARAATADELMAGAFAHGRHADALPALAGAVAGIRFGSGWIPEQLATGPIELDGVCIPQLAGARLDDTISALVAAADDQEAAA